MNLAYVLSNSIEILIVLGLLASGLYTVTTYCWKKATRIVTFRVFARD
jgi:hypothetical protein